jgi:hypothetical protein
MTTRCECEKCGGQSNNPRLVYLGDIEVIDANLAANHGVVFDDDDEDEDQDREPCSGNDIATTTFTFGGDGDIDWRLEAFLLAGERRNKRPTTFNRTCSDCGHTWQQ